MMERIAEASPRPRSRITGVVYLLYFLTAVSAEVFVGRGRLVVYDAVNLIAYAFYITVTLLFYYMFKPVNRSLSLLAAFSSLAGSRGRAHGENRGERRLVFHLRRATKDSPVGCSCLGYNLSVLMNGRDRSL